MASDGANDTYMVKSIGYKTDAGRDILLIAVFADVLDRLVTPSKFFLPKGADTELCQGNHKLAWPPSRSLVERYGILQSLAA